MKKNLYNFFALMLGFMAFTACSPDMDEVFDESASARAGVTMKKLSETLQSAPNGWRMEYYGWTSYGGFNVFVKFGKDDVTVASEKVGATHNAGFDADGNLKTYTSRYKIEQSQGTILSFDDYNEIFHYLSDPRNSDYGTDGEGFEGDFEFRVLEISADKIRLQGKKHGATIMMYPIPAGQTWEDYVNEVNATMKYMASRSYDLKVEGNEREISVTQSYRRLIFTYYNDKEEMQTVGAPFVVTPEGYKFYKPVEVDGTEIAGFKKGDTQEYFVAENDSKVLLYTYLPTLAESLEGGTWFIAYKDLGTFAQPYWEAMRGKLKTAGPSKTPNRLYWAIIGTYLDKKALHMQAGGDFVYQGINFNALNEEGTEVNMKWNSGYNTRTNKTYYNSYGMKGALEPFVGTRGRDFVLTTDNRRNPTYMIMTDKNEPTNVIKLWAEQYTYVYDELDNYDE